MKRSSPEVHRRVLLVTNSTDRGSTSRTFEGWTRILPGLGVTPLASVGGPGALLDALRSQGIPTFVCPIRIWPSKRWPFPFLLAALRLASIIRKQKVDVIHVNEHDHHRVPAFAARLTGVPIVTHLRFTPEPAHAQWLFREPYTPRRLFFTSRTQLRDASAAISTVVPESDWRVIYNGLDARRFEPDSEVRRRQRDEWRIDDSAMAIGVACAISRRKQLDHFVRLIHRLRNAGVNVCGYIAGHPIFADDEVVVSELHTLISELNLQDRVTFLGYVEPSAPLFQGWDIAISTSAYETFGMSVLEGMASACATVAYEGGAVAEVAADAALIVRDGDEDALFDACLKICRDESLRASLAQRAQARAREFDIGQAASALAAEYRAVASESST